MCGLRRTLTESASIKGELGDICDAQPNLGDVAGGESALSDRDGLRGLIHDTRLGRDCATAVVSTTLVSRIPRLVSLVCSRFSLRTLKTCCRISMSTITASEDKLTSSPWCSIC